MTIDERGRSAGAALRTQTGQLNAVQSLEDLVAGVRRRQRVRTAVTALGAAAVVFAGLAVTARVNRADVTASSSLDENLSPTELCDLEFVECAAGARFTADLQQPMTWTLPDGFDRRLQYL